MNLIKSFFLATLVTSLSVSAADDYEKALKSHAQASAYSLMTELIGQRKTGASWGTLLTRELPEKFDDVCGLQDRLGLTDDVLTQMKPSAKRLIGDRLGKEFSQILARPNASLDLEATRSVQIATGDHALVILKVKPARPGDIRMGLLYRMSGSGQMALCDVTAGQWEHEGVLSTLAREIQKQ